MGNIPLFLFCSGNLPRERGIEHIDKLTVFLIGQSTKIKGLDGLIRQTRHPLLECLTLGKLKWGQNAGLGTKSANKGQVDEINGRRVPGLTILPPFQVGFDHPPGFHHPPPLRRVCSMQAARRPVDLLRKLSYRQTKRTQLLSNWHTPNGHTTPMGLI